MGKSHVGFRPPLKLQRTSTTEDLLENPPTPPSWNGGFDGQIFLANSVSESESNLTQTLIIKLFQTYLMDVLNL